MLLAAMDPLEVASEIVRRLPEPAVLLNAGHAIAAHNVAFRLLTGRKRRELERSIEGGATVYGLLVTEDHRSRVEKCFGSGRTIHLWDVEVTSADEQVRLMQQTLLAVVDDRGDAVGVIEMFRDVTGEAQVQAKYREMLAKERVRADELERSVAERTKELTRALEEVGRLSRTDPLTGVLNRRAFTDHAEQALAMAARYKRCGAILMCDLDRFKKLNDTFGHQAGDVVLKAVTEALQAGIRKSDKLARFGGEEFVILLTEADSAAVVPVVAERCRQLVRQLPVSDLVPGKSTPQTVSIGVALFPDHGTSLDRLLGCADIGLYAAKERGRDQVVTFSSEFEQTSSAPPKPVVRILVVAREQDLAGSYRGCFGEEFDVTVAHAGTRALSYCAQQPFDVVIADEDVATENGVDFLHKSIVFCPTAVRVLVIKTPDVYLAIRGTNSAQVDRFVLRHEAKSLRSAVDEALSQRSLERGDLALARNPSLLSGEAIEAFERLIEERRVYLAYQPIVRANDRTVFAYEALCRSKEPHFPTPDVLFDAAVKLGSLWTLGRLLRRMVAEDIPRLPPEARIFVNLHPSEMSDHEILEGEPSLRPFADRVVFEITERGAVPDVRRFMEAIGQLREFGYQLAIDDLGAGYASLNSVALLNPDFVKVDMALVRQVDNSSRKRALIQSILSYANAEDVQVVSEGVETEEEARTLVDLGTHLMQGYLFGRPEPLSP